MLISELVKKEVLDAKANKIGNIVDANLDIIQGTVMYYMLRTGILKKVPLPPEEIDKIGEKIILKVNKEEVEGRHVRASM